MRLPAIALSLLVAACSDGGGADPGSAPNDAGTSASTGEPTDPNPTSSTAAETATDPTAAPPSCGDGQVDEGESCDDGPANSDQGACTTYCRFGVCGDGLVHAGVEECDDGNPFNNDGCLVACKLPRCGDGYVHPAEACDDGNTIDDDDCPNDCSFAECGDGVVQLGEQCDDGNTLYDDACLNTCMLATCGDGILHKGVEQCDDGNDSDADACTVACVPPSCSDGVQNGFESDLDCGGVYCDGCPLGHKCAGNLDCGDGICQQSQCSPPLPLMPPACAPAAVDHDAAWAQIHTACNCHGSGAGALKFNSADSLRDSNVDVWPQTANIPLVTPGDIDRSYLIFKVLNQQSSVPGGRGSRMPIAKALSETQICALINWVASGAN